MVILDLCLDCFSEVSGTLIKMINLHLTTVLFQSFVIHGEANRQRGTEVESHLLDH